MEGNWTFAKIFQADNSRLFNQTFFTLVFRFYTLLEYSVQIYPKDWTLWQHTRVKVIEIYLQRKKCDQIVRGDIWFLENTTWIHALPRTSTYCCHTNLVMYGHTLWNSNSQHTAPTMTAYFMILTHIKTVYIFNNLIACVTYSIL